MNKLKLAKVLKKLGGKDLIEKVLVSSLQKEIEGVRRSIPPAVDLSSVLLAHAQLTRAVESLSETSQTQNKDLDLELSLLRSKVRDLSDSFGALKYASPKDLQELRVSLLAIVANTGGGNANRNEQVDGVNVLRPFTDINWKSGSNISITAVANQNTKYTDITIAAVGSGVTLTAETPSGTIDGSNLVFTVSNTPVQLFSDGMYRVLNTDYTYVGGIITMNALLAPVISIISYYNA